MTLELPRGSWKLTRVFLLLGKMRVIKNRLIQYVVSLKALSNRRDASPSLGYFYG